MAAPEYVPSAPTTAKHYNSPPQRGGWSANRPGETFATEESSVSALGSQGPDQGYALKLVGVFEKKIALAGGEHRSDVNAGVVVVGTKRASQFGRAPVVHDLRIAYTVFGGSSESSLNIVSGDGSGLICTASEFLQLGGVMIADVNGDGLNEVVGPTTDGRVKAVDGACNHL